MSNRTGIDGIYDMRAAETVIVDRGRRVVTLTSPTSAVFLARLDLDDAGHITECAVTTMVL